MEKSLTDFVEKLEKRSIFNICEPCELERIGGVTLISISFYQEFLKDIEKKEGFLYRFVFTL